MPEVIEPSSSPIAKSSTKKKWFWGALGVASVAVLGFALTRVKPTKTKSSQKKSDLFLSEWAFIKEIDNALATAHIEGIEIYLKGNQVLLVASPESKVNLARAIELVKALNGIGSVSGVVHETESASNGKENFFNHSASRNQ